ncbi:MAG: peptidoglycan binding domain-containing protein, partial [Candidatus Kerfeldbacteria bacterium]|nr:peptidoglycan binding domain-containing protein [Candidatus Kerfeldbacteria bacterium]
MSLKHKHFSKHWLWLVFPLVFLFLLTASLAIYHLAYAGRIFPGVAVGGIDVGGLTVNQAQDKLQTAWRNFMDKGVVVKYEKYQVTVPEILNASNQDLVVTVMGFSSATAAIEVYKVGRQGIWYNDLFIPLLARWLPKYGQAAAVVEVDIERIIKYIDHSLPNIQITPQAASLALSEDGKPFIVPEKSGVLINQAGLAEELQTKLQTLTPTPVYLQVQPVLPALVTADLVNLLPVAQTLLAKNVNLIFTFEDKTWLIKPVVWRQWLQPIKESGEAKLIFETKLVKGALTEATAYVNQPAVNAKFELTDGRVQVFAASQEGREVDLSATLRSAVEQLSTADQDLSIPLI